MQSNNPTQVGAIIDAAKPCRQDISGSTYAGSFQRPAPRPITAEDIFQQYAQLVSEDGKTLDYDAQTRHALETAARWLKDPSAPWCLLLTGTPGTGKTTLIQAIRAALRASGARSIPDCFTALQVAEFDETDRFRYNAICRDFSFVAIDDIGTESAPQPLRHREAADQDRPGGKILTPPSDYPNHEFRTPGDPRPLRRPHRRPNKRRRNRAVFWRLISRQPLADQR